jgi:Periplasmic copper-binding protein (NosD)
MSRATFPLIALIAVATPLTAQSDRQPFLVEETGRSFWRLDDAVKAIGGGEGTITIAPGTYEDCAVQSEGAITYRAARAGTVILQTRTCEDKAALVLRGLAARVEGIIFQNMRVPDGNGSGIRLEKGNLDVTNSIFRNSEQGILTAHDPQSEIRITDTTFSGLGGCPSGGCTHSIYLGDNASLTVARCRFDRGTGGHYVKSRAVRNDITDNSFDDTQGRSTNYMIDLSNGSVGAIARNVFVQGRNKENHSAMITVGPELRKNPSAGLVVTDNEARMAPGAGWNTTFVADWTREPLKISNNRLGAGITVFDRR